MERAVYAVYWACSSGVRVPEPASWWASVAPSTKWRLPMIRSWPPEKKPLAAWRRAVSLVAANSPSLMPEASIRARTTFITWS